MKFKILLLAILIGGGLYWFLFRPALVRHNCSWVLKTSEFKPEVTQADVDKRNAECENNFDGTRFGRVFCNLKPSPAEPAKEWYEPANSSQYQFCLHNKGL